MPASSHGFPTSLIRPASPAQLAAADLDRVDVRPVRRVAGERLVALDGALLELDLGAEDVEPAARLALEDGQREPPVALLRDHPVVHVPEPVELVLAAELRDPADALGDRHDLRARLVHADEPLVDDAEEELGGAAPADRVAVRVGLGAMEALARRKRSVTSRATVPAAFPVSGP